MAILLKNGFCLNGHNEWVATDLLIEDGKIRAKGLALEDVRINENLEIIDCADKLIAPGFVDVHVHFREPGFTHKETIQTGSLAAARGGFTTVCAMPNLDPVPDNVSDFLDIEQRIEKDAVIDVRQYAPITKSLRSETLVDMAALKEAGAFAFTNDGVGVQTAGTMYLAMKKAKELEMSIVAHTEDESLLFGGCMHHGAQSEKLGLPGILSATESSQIARDCLLAEETGVHYHVCHVSTKESVRVIRDAKRVGVNVTAEVCPHHLILTDAAITSDNSQFKMNPPLRAEEDRLALIEGLLDGTIDCLATDHAPHHADEKALSMTEAPFGIVGSETAFALMNHHFVKTGIFTLQQVIDWLTYKPARLFKLPVGTLDIGARADITVLDVEKQYEINEQDFASKSHNTPFLNQTVTGQVLYTFSNGQKVWDEQEERS
ncbi:dihydroorotase [Vagococcus sp.]|uniref:dihydroorotase n=1 Tax=Vagococcus sp. TaxID=1933889 RepID=UPI000EE36363|nr:dihydroorotase [Vagococcus sp.]HCT95959.1 dihydroorotase [Vagococcus sp.]